MYQLEPLSANESGPCKCCGGRTCAVSGLIYRDGSVHAGYQAMWTAGQVERHGAHFLFITGSWGEGSRAAERSAVALGFRYHEDGSGSSFTVLDANPPDASLAGRALRRDEVVGTPLAREIFDMVDYLWLHDARLAEVTGLEYDGNSCDECEQGMERQEEEPDFFEVPDFDGSPAPESAAVPSPPSLITVAGVWLLGGLFLAGGIGMLAMDASLTSKVLGGFLSLLSVLAMVEVTRRRRRGNRYT